MAKKPRDAVFTTALWDGNSKIADFEKHLERLAKHAERLRITLPESFDQLISQAIIDMDEKYDEEE